MFLDVWDVFEGTGNDRVGGDKKSVRRQENRAICSSHASKGKVTRAPLWSAEITVGSEGAIA